MPLDRGTIALWSWLLLLLLAVAGAAYALVVLMPRNIERWKRQEAFYRANSERHPRGWALMKKELRFLPVAVVVLTLGAIAHRWSLVILFGSAMVVGLGFDFYRAERRHRQGRQ